VSDPPPSSLLVVDDDPSTRRFLVENLVLDRFVVQTAESAERALEVLARTRQDAVVVDLCLPGLSGLDLIGTVREAVDGPWDPAMPILLISGHADPHTAVRGLDRGADDVLAKPLAYPELLARLHARLRRAAGDGAGPIIRAGSVVVDRRARRATVDGRAVHLSTKEFALLVALVRDPERVVGKRELLRDVWGFASSGRTRTVDSHASRLRRKLIEAGAPDRYVANVWGVGYRFLPHNA
jgi:DNA-binding response OmpR family regulator